MGARTYFSDRNQGVPEPVVDGIGGTFWEGFCAAVQRRIADGSFAESFPKPCFESPYACETDADALGGAFVGDLPAVPWPLRAREVPVTRLALDAVEFFARHVSRVATRTQHAYARHDHLVTFDREAGRREFREDVNAIFLRNGHPYSLSNSGQIERVGGQVLDELVGAARFQTGDVQLDGLLADAVRKSRSPDAPARRGGLEKLWDAWERAKSLGGSSKRDGVESLARAAVPQHALREVVLREAKALTALGNTHQIRHFEAGTAEIGSPDQVDYLFYRLFALLRLLVLNPQQGG